jgi:hypothetical protein
MTFKSIIIAFVPQSFDKLANIINLYSSTQIIYKCKTMCSIWPFLVRNDICSMNINLGVPCA